MRSIVVLVLSILVSAVGISQDIIIRDAYDQKALAKAEVSNDKGIIVFTNRKGIFQLDTFKNDALIYVTYTGYYTRKVVVNDISKKDPTIKLTSKTMHLETANVTPKGESTAAEATQQIEVIESRKIQFGNPATTASVLENSGLVSIQRSQLGGGSPQIRGFEANKVLLVIDGVRMNNAIYRSGHVQNAITVDANVLDKTEVYFGPSSVLFGSDALGGVIHFKTKKPVLAEEFNKNITRVNVMGRMASASQERTLHADIMYGAKKWGMLTSITHTDFGDLRMGANRQHGYEEWGLVPQYITQEEGVDVIRDNADPNIQKYTGYSQIDFLQKFTYKASERTEFNVNFQYSNSSDIPRFDRLNDVRDGQLRFAEWYYGPQRRTLTTVNAHLTDRKHFTEANITLAHQRIDEDRIDRGFGRTSRFMNEEDVNVVSLNADFSLEKNPTTTWFYGAEVTYNHVESTSTETNIQTGEVLDAITRYPNGGSDYSTMAVYASRNKKLNEKLEWNFGLRYNHTLAESEFFSTEFFELPYNSITINDGALTGNVSLLYRPNTEWKIAGGIASGFKSPNVDDYGKVFERDGFVVVPNSDLKSEYVYSADFTVERALLEQKLLISATPYYTYLTNAIVRRDTVLNGSDQFLFEGDLAKVTTNKNAAQAHIYGISAKVRYSLNDEWLASATYNYTYGQDLSDDVPMSHISPQFGKVNVEYQKGRFTAEAFMLYAFSKDADRFGPGTTDNLAEAVEEGIPAWHTFNLRTSTKVSKTVILQVAVENILDLHYKTFASGLSSPGRNFIVSVKSFF
ncbi:MAG: TonB-dependent receptor plug domain-containing protein [Flavobacteriales bacterium]